MGAPEVRATAAGNIDEQFFHMLADAIPHLVWSSGVDGFEDYCNRRLCEYTGLSREAMSGSGWEAIVHPDDLERCLAAWMEARAGGSRFEVEYRLRRHDGAYLWHHGTAEPLRLGGRIVRWFGTCTDIDARKRAEERVEELQRTSRVIADGIPHMLWTAGADGTLDFLNAHTLEYTGLTAEQTRNGAWQEVLHPEDRARCVECWQSALAKGEGYEDEYRLKRRDGAYRWHRHCILPMRDEGGRIAMWYGTCTDVDDQRRGAERLERERSSLEKLVASRTEALRASEARLRAIIQNEPECVKLLDAQGLLLEMNAAGLGMIEADSLAQVQNECIYGIIAPAHRNAFRELTERVCRGERGTLEFELVGLKGARRWMQTHAAPFHDASRQDTLLLAITRDITEQRRVERALRENEARVVKATETVRLLMNRLMHAQEAERRRLAGDLHDLIGQKLTALGINLDIVRQQMPQAGASAAAIRLHQMSILLEETIGAIREVMADLRPQVLDEHGLSAALFQYAATFEARTGLHVEVSAAGPRMLLPHDVAISLFRITQEALTNAAKHSGASRVLVRVRKTGERVELQVEDDGRGMRETVAERRRTRGGWGLRMMRERAEAVGGRLTVAAAHPGTRIVVDIVLTNADKRHPG